MPDELAVYQDQTDVFFDGPAAYLLARFPGQVDPTFPQSPMPGSPPGMPTVRNWTHAWPSHLIMFGALMDDRAVKDLLTERGYSEVWSVSNGWEEDPRRRGGVKVWKWAGN
jgi:GPI mannosyltransferase 3